MNMTSYCGLVCREGYGHTYSPILLKRPMRTNGTAEAYDLLSLNKKKNKTSPLAACLKPAVLNQSHTCTSCFSRHPKLNMILTTDYNFTHYIVDGPTLGVRVKPTIQTCLLH